MGLDRTEHYWLSHLSTRNIPGSITYLISFSPLSNIMMGIFFNVTYRETEKKNHQGAQTSKYQSIHINLSQRLMLFLLHYLFFTSLDLYWESTYSSHQCQDQCLLGEQIGSLASKECSLSFKLNLTSWRVSSQWSRAVFIDLANQGSSVFRKSPTEFAPVSAGCQELKLVPPEHYTLELFDAGTLISSSCSHK